MNSKIALKSILVVAIFFSAANLLAQEEITNVQNPEMQTFDSYPEVGYDQILRPQFHFSSLKGWLNDPNGLVWYDGEYHLFFQHNPKGTQWGNMTWGHAVSTDMVHWRQLPHAILPYGGGTIFSGTAVVDHNNSLGKQKGDVKTLVAFFTFAKQPFYQAAAYSTDKGRTFNLVKNGAPMVPNQGFDLGERDPKVFWHQESQKWVMVLWIKKGTPSGTPQEKLGKVRFFSSDNLADWTVESDIDREWVYECMDFVELPVDGDLNHKKWLLYDASFDYEIGTFDGHSFTSHNEVFKGDFGNNFYAAQSFNNSPDDRTVMMGWMSQGGDNSIFLKAKMPFNQCMSFPTTMELRTTADGIRLHRWPIEEIENLYVKSHKFKNLTATKATQKLAEVKGELIDLSIEFESTKPMKLTLRGLEITYDQENEMFVFENNKLPAPAINGKVTLRVLLDRATLELFANQGAAVSTNYVIPVDNNPRITLSADDDLRIKSLVVNELKSSW